MAQAATQNVLLLSNDPQVVRPVRDALAPRKIGVTVADTLADAAGRLEQGAWDIVMVDLETSADAFDLAIKSRQGDPARPVMAIGPQGDGAGAARSMREGCRIFLLKPLRPEDLDVWIGTLLSAPPTPSATCTPDPSHEIVAASDRFLQTIALARKIAPTTVPVLIIGESGTGKELLSHLIHHSSDRRDAPYIRINCAALNESLLESELFGHERGAFTGAFAQRKGRFELAHGGTLLLDEISETGPRLQAELLRVLEQQDFERVGGMENVRVNVRIVSTTNRDLVADVEQGRFRRDLYYRLAGLRLAVPSLRERPEDVEVLVWHFVNLYAHEVGRKVAELDDEMLQLFREHSWPGNVRQLRNVVRAALILGEGATLSLEDLGELKDELLAEAPPPVASPTLQLQEMERRTILAALDRTQRNQVKAARLLGITDRTLREKLRRYRKDESECGMGVPPMCSTGVSPVPESDTNNFPARGSAILASPERKHQKKQQQQDTGKMPMLQQDMGKMPMLQPDAVGEQTW